MHIAGRCHCGNIRVALEWPQDCAEIPARSCDCSFCVKHGGVWTSHPRARLRARIADPAQVSAYAFGTNTATFHICARCGAVPFASCEIDGRTFAVVNINTLEHIDPACLQRATAHFDGEDIGSRLQRRQRNWIADVSLITDNAG